MYYSLHNAEQVKVLRNATQLFESLELLRLEDGSFAGSMHWKHISGRDYLYRSFTGGRAKSLGVRSAETELLKERFELGKAEHKNRTLALKDRIQIHAGYIRANRLHRFPVKAARIVRALQRAKIPHRVIGTNALHVYEMSGGVMFMPEHLATEDVDVLLDDRQHLRVMAALRSETMLSIIQKTNRTFRRFSDAPTEFAAVDDDGYRVELLSQGGRREMQPSEFSRCLDDEDLRPAEIVTLKWFLSSPHFDEVVFDERGMPVRVDTVDPRAFVLYKHFVSQRDERRPAKRHRDREHAQAVASLIQDRLKHLSPGKVISQSFPREVREEGDDEYSL